MSSTARSCAAHRRTIGEAGAAPDHTVAMTGSSTSSGCTALRDRHRWCTGAACSASDPRHRRGGAQIGELSALAPLHNPANLAGIRAARPRSPGCPTLPYSTPPSTRPWHRTPTAMRSTRRLRRPTGCAGTASTHSSGMSRAGRPNCSSRRSQAHCVPPRQRGIGLRDRLRSLVETSMGMTRSRPGDGHRAGDIDPGALFHLAARLRPRRPRQPAQPPQRAPGCRAAATCVTCSPRRGGEPSRKPRSTSTTPAAPLPRRYLVLLGGVDAIVFTAGWGEQPAHARCHGPRSGGLGVQLDEALNVAPAGARACHPPLGRKVLVVRPRRARDRQAGRRPAALTVPVLS